MSTPKANKTAKPVRRRQEDRSRDTKKKLLAAARKCVARDGYVKASISKITAEAGLTRGAHLHHYATKEQLIEAMAEDAGRQVYRRLGILMLNLDNETDRLERLIEAIWQKVMLTTEGKLILECMNASRIEPKFAKHFGESFAHVNAMFDVAALHYFEPQPGSDIMPDTMFNMIMQQLYGMLLNRPLYKNQRYMDADLQTLTQMASQFIRPKKGVTGPPPRLQDIPTA